MAQFSKKVLATWAAVVVAEEIDLNLDDQHTTPVDTTPVVDDFDEEKFDEEKFDMNLGDDAEGLGGLGDLFGGLFGGEASDETKEIFAKHDANADGKLDADEFADYLGEMMWEMSAEQRQGKDYIEVAAASGMEGLSEMDANGDGQITKEEYKANSGAGAAPGDGFLEMLDANKTGGLEIEEFGFVVNMFGMSKGGMGGDHHDHDHHDHSTCGGHHGHAHDHAHEHEHEHHGHSCCGGHHEHEEQEFHDAVEEHEHEDIDVDEHVHEDLDNATCSANTTSCCADDACESAEVYYFEVEEPKVSTNSTSILEEDLEESSDSVDATDDHVREDSSSCDEL